MSDYKNKLESSMGLLLQSAGVPFSYEKVRVPYTKEHYYLPDFFVLANSWGESFYIETKGRFLPCDRKKHLLIQAQHPELDIRFAFSQPKARLSKRSKTTYAEWCEKHGFLYCGKVLPKTWL